MGNINGQTTLQELQDLLKKATSSVDLLKGREQALLKKFVIDLTVAGEQTIYIAGNFIYIDDATDYATSINVQFSRKDADIDYYNLTMQKGWIYPYDKVHLSWNAQVGKTITILIGNLAPDLLMPIDNRSPVSTVLQDILEELQGQTTAGAHGNTAVSSGAGGTKVLSASALRHGFIIQQKSANTGNMYIGFSNTVSATSYAFMLRLGTTDFFGLDDYRGDIYIIAGVNNEQVAWGIW